MEKLNKFAKKVTSQYGEDGIIDYIIKHIPSIPKVCVEFGAWDGKFLSNSYNLWHNKIWEGILIECDSDKANKIKSNYKNYNVSIFNQLILPEGKGSIDELFKLNDLNPDIGLISIDIDSYDYYVFKNMNYINAAIVIVEHNPSIPGYIEYYDPPEEVFLRCSAKALEKVGNEKGYKLVCCTIPNSIFVRNDLFNPQYFPDKPVEYLFDYSNCDKPRLSAAQSPANNLIPIHYGLLSWHNRAFLRFKTCFRAIFSNRKCYIPADNIVNHCKKFGIYIG